MGRITSRVPVTRVRLRDGAIERRRRPDSLAVEEPLEIRCAGRVVTVTMRTPGNDLDLAHGYLLSEGIIGVREDVRGARYCAGATATGPEGTAQNTYNVLEVELVDPDVARLDSVSRDVFTSSSCGVCGSASIDAVASRVPAGIADRQAVVEVAEVARMLDALRATQDVFARTGGLHAAGLFRVDGSLVAAAEDVGRHNAVDKVLGAALLADALPMTDGVLVVSSRASFEIVQKAAMGGIAIVVVVSAPSSLAVETASALGMTLIAFAREGSMNVYCGEDRLVD